MEGPVPFFLDSPRSTSKLLRERTCWRHGGREFSRIEFWPRRVDPAQPRGGLPLCPWGFVARAAVTEVTCQRSESS
jgi:hypothetical protein